MTTEYQPSEEMLFEVLTPLGFWVHVTQHYWSLIVEIKHPVMSGQEAVVKKVLEDPEEIRLSRSDPDVYLFYRSERPRRWVCAVTKCEGDEGFLITAYPTDAIKEGIKIWPR
jgi:hypothetical protein